MNYTKEDLRPGIIYEVITLWKITRVDEDNVYTINVKPNGEEIDGGVAVDTVEKTLRRFNTGIWEVISSSYNYEIY